LVLSELDAIVSSHHFRNSKRYPALLNYVVKKTLEGHTDQLKERTLGIEVFDRSPSYDTNTDPVVRFSAGEVRKRIAQFYHERGGEPPVQIDLPLGSYVPEFKLRPSLLPRAEESLAEPATHPEDQAQATPALSVAAVESLDNPSAFGPATPRRVASRARLVFRWRFFWPVALLMTLVPVAVASYILHRNAATTIADNIWRPVLKAPGPVQIVISTMQREVPSPPDPAHEVMAADLHGAYHRISRSS
jgi:hypothetical protein